MPWKYWSSFINSKLTNIFYRQNATNTQMCIVSSSENVSIWHRSFVDVEKWIQCTNNDPTGKTYFLWKSSLSLSCHVNWLWHCVHCPLKTAPADSKCTVELHLTGLAGTASQPDTQKIRITGFFFQNILHWQFEMETNFYKRLF